MEFPVVDYPATLGQAYDRLYVAEADGPSALPTRLARVTVPDGEATTWSDPGTFPGEPMFVRAPADEDTDGVLLSVVLDAETDETVLVVLDATTMDELARAPLPHRLPYGFHGQFYAADDPVRSMA